MLRHGRQCTNGLEIHDHVGDGFVSEWDNLTSPLVSFLTLSLLAFPIVIMYLISITVTSFQVIQSFYVPFMKKLATRPGFARVINIL